ncbi:MAG TPA: UDP-glucose--hexose-1-phosphate uridylyltransferase [Candidatus Limnocylindrales bacterium]|nr:UDP-glucose--hexose-1-phosphate uridylyltransferase [Candidatus Limnocylindrales bacterium]
MSPDRASASGDEAGPPSSPHRRFNALTGEWVLVSAERTQRPWQGDVLPSTDPPRPRYDPTCYLCPGNTRASGDQNPPYTSTFAFTNDFAALRPDGRTTRTVDGLLEAQGERGTCRVLCFSPRHDLTLGELDPAAVCDVIDLWAEESTALGRDYAWVQVFENRGREMGASNPHPHGQIWAGSAIPVEAERELERQRRHHQRTGRPLLLDYAGQERGGPRVVAENDEWLTIVPFWAVWPFEILLIPKAPVRRLADLDSTGRTSLATSLIGLLSRYDNLFAHPFPYSMGWHQAPFGRRSAAGWQLHAHFYPPLLRSPTIRKFMVGYELLAEPQRDLTAEEAARRLRAASDRREPSDGTATTPSDGRSSAT